jgi:hypothetical protein
MTFKELSEGQPIINKVGSKKSFSTACREVVATGVDKAHKGYDPGTQACR